MPRWNCTLFANRQGLSLAWLGNDSSQSQSRVQIVVQHKAQQREGCNGKCILHSKIGFSWAWSQNKYLHVLIILNLVTYCCILHNMLFKHEKINVQHIFDYFKIETIIQELVIA
jgi:hypothetical protein